MNKEIRIEKAVEGNEPQNADMNFRSQNLFRHLSKNTMMKVDLMATKKQMIYIRS